MLKKELSEWLNEFNEVTVPKLLASGFKPNPINAREGLANLTKGLVTELVTVEEVIDDYIEAKEFDVPVRIYNPSKAKNLPVMIFLHGGGHMAGSVTVYDPICKRLAKTSNHIVVSVEYRLAPENPFPAGLNDCINAAKGVFNTLDRCSISHRRTLSIIGDSGGGANVSLVTAELQESKEVSIENQILIYPSLDYTMSSKSMEENGVGYLLGKGKIAWYFDHYFKNGEDRKAVSPLYKEMGPNMPKTLIFTAQYDPLRDEGMEYTKKLKEAKVSVEHHNLENMIHTYMSMEDICKEECKFTYDKINKFLNQ